MPYCCEMEYATPPWSLIFSHFCLLDLFRDCYRCQWWFSNPVWHPRGCTCYIVLFFNIWHVRYIALSFNIWNVRYIALSFNIWHVRYIALSFNIWHVRYILSRTPDCTMLLSMQCLFVVCGWEKQVALQQSWLERLFITIIGVPCYLP